MVHSHPEIQRFHVGVKAVITEGNYFLLVKRRDYGHWELPGGRINCGETDLATSLKRELYEELPGIRDVCVGHLLQAKQADFTLADGSALMLLFFAVTATLPRTLRSSAEHTDAQWMDTDQLNNMPVKHLHKQVLRSLLH